MFKKIFSLDTRSLGIFRILFGTFFFIDIVDRLQSFRAHYTDFGVLPAEYMRQIVTKGQNGFDVVDNAIRSLNMISGSTGWQVLVFTIYIAAAVCFTIGYKTRFATIACWVASVSLANASVLLVYPADYLFTSCFLASLFLPMGASFSVDSRNQEQMPTQVQGWPAVPIFVVLFFFMFSAGICKRDASWFDGTAVKNVMMNTQYSTPLRELLLPLESLMSFMTYTTLVIEIAGPFLMFVTIWGGRLRAFGTVAKIGFLLSVRLFVHSQNLSFILATAFVAMLPTAFWNILLTRAQKLSRHIPGTLSIDSQTQNQQPGFQAWKSRLSTSFAILFLVLSLLLEWNRAVKMKYPLPEVPVPSILQSAISFTRLENNNFLFASTRKLQDGWVVILAKTKSGQSVDLVSGQPNDLTYNSRNDISSMDLRWRRYYYYTFLTRISDSKPVAQLRHLYAQHYCRLWEEKNPDNPIEDSVEVIRYDFVIKEGDLIASDGKESWRQTFSCTEKVNFVMAPQASN